MIPFLIRWVVTLAMAAAVYRGSRGTLVAFLILQAAANEMAAYLIGRQRREWDEWRSFQGLVSREPPA